MHKEYLEIKFGLGNEIKDAVNKLLQYKEDGILACGEFNGVMLHSDTVTMDEAYKLIIGKTKVEHDESILKWEQDIKRKEQEHKENVPGLTEIWMQKGREVLTEDKWEYWDEIVPVRLNDLYQGMELGCCLDIVSILNNNGSLAEAKNKIDSQDHSGMSHGLVCAMVCEFCDRGNEFVEYVR